MTFLTSTVRTARTPKWCRLCGCPIVPGARYIDWRGVDCGSAYAWPYHEFCEWWMDVVDGDAGEWPELVMAENWHEYVTPPWDDPLHQFATVIGWWAQWRTG